MARPIHKLSEEAVNEIARFRREIDLLEKGQRDMDDFKRFRLNNGIYGIRGTSDEHMIRIKLPFGEMTADQSPRFMSSLLQFCTPHASDAKARNRPAYDAASAASGSRTRKTIVSTMSHVREDRRTGSGRSVRNDSGGIE